MQFMSSNISHSPSLMFNGTSHFGRVNRKDNMSTLAESVCVAGSRSLRDSSLGGSPLQIFVKAKKKINDIYQEIEEYVVETSNFVHGIPSDKNDESNADLKEIEKFASRVAGIKEVLSRNNMKVAFFGRTSNGKSTVINAMLGDKILPSGIGHTTNCFLQVQGDESAEPFLVTESSSEKQNINSISQLAHALCNNRMGDSSLVQIHWPKTRCQLLRDDVVFVDSPGIDVSEDLDEWIDKHCLDADVFVLVANSESTLMNTEKNFFHKVSAKLSKPNIFILQNRWDVAASEPEFLTEVRRQHSERTVDFLVKELRVVDKAHAEERVFFVSAKEALLLRLNEARGNTNGSPGNNDLPDGYSNRYFDFQDFERKFEECISKTAVVTKFSQHTKRGKTIGTELQALMNCIYDRCIVAREKKLEERNKLQKKLDHTDSEVNSITSLMKEKICSLVEDVERKVSNAMNEEIRRFFVLVDEFNEPFHPDPLVLSVYKRTLNAHVEAGLGLNLRSRLSSALATNIESSKQEMTKRMIALLKPEKKELAMSLLPRREPFEVLFKLNCENLCQDFQEDIQFKFSLGIVSLVQRFLGSASSRLVKATHKEKIPRQIPMTPMTPSNEPVLSQDDWSIISRFAVATVGSQGTMGLAIAMGVLFKTVGWRLVLLTGGVYGCLYAYERLTWTNKARERTFKRQYIEHATRNLRLIVDLTSYNCSHQVQQELTGTFARLCHLVDETSSQMHQDIRALEREAESLDNTATTAKKLKNKANYLINELNIFQQSYLTPDD